VFTLAIKSPQHALSILILLTALIFSFCTSQDSMNTQSLYEMGEHLRSGFDIVHGAVSSYLNQNATDGSMN